MKLERYGVIGDVFVMWRKWVSVQAKGAGPRPGARVNGATRVSCDNMVIVFPERTRMDSRQLCKGLCMQLARIGEQGFLVSLSVEYREHLSAPQGETLPIESQCQVNRFIP